MNTYSSEIKKQKNQPASELGGEHTGDDSSSFHFTDNRPGAESLTVLQGLIQTKNRPLQTLNGETPIQARLEWTMAKIEDHPSNTDQPTGTYQALLDQMRRYETEMRELEDDDPSIVTRLKEIMWWCNSQLENYPDENRNLLVIALKDNVEAEIGRLSSDDPNTFLIRSISMSTKEAGVMCRVVAGMNIGMARQILDNIRQNAAEEKPKTLTETLSAFGAVKTNRVNDQEREKTPYMFEWGIAKIKGAETCFIMGSSGKFTSPVDWGPVLPFADPIAHSHPLRMLRIPNGVSLGEIFAGPAAVSVLPTNSDFMMPGRKGMTEHTVYTPYHCEQNEESGQWTMDPSFPKVGEGETLNLTFYFSNIRRTPGEEDDEYNADLRINAGGEIIAITQVKSFDSQNQQLINLKHLKV